MAYQATRRTNNDTTHPATVRRICYSAGGNVSLSGGVRVIEHISENCRSSDPWVWTLARYRAAIRVAVGTMRDPDIAAEAGIQARQLRNWKRHPTFAAHVATIAQRGQDAVADFAIADKRVRMAALQDLFDRQWSIVEERATEQTALAEAHAKESHMKGVRNLAGHGEYPAGGRSGLIVRQVKVAQSLVIEEFAADTGLAKSIMATLEQAATEAGQRETKVGVVHSGTIRHSRNLSALSDGELDQLEALVGKIDRGEMVP